jgi:hypothetical protein
MTHTAQTQPTPKTPRRKTAGSIEARRLIMSSALTKLEDTILDILRKAQGEPLSLPQIEKSFTEQGITSFDTFDVRDAVWSLIEQQRAEFTPRRYVVINDK